MRRSRPNFRTTARQRLTDERNVSLAVGGLLSDEAVPAATVQVVSVERLALHPDIDPSEPDAAQLEELVESVRDLGILAPIIARPSADAAKLEVLDGARRLRAARVVGHIVAPVIVHEMDDASARTFVALGRRGRPIPYHRLLRADAATGPERVPVVISGPAED